MYMNLGKGSSFSQTFFGGNLKWMVDLFLVQTPYGLASL